MPISESELILNADGSIYHLGLRPGEVGDFIITVGDPDRVAMVSAYFDSIELKRQRREFVTHTGYLGKQRLSVISSGIGTDNVEIVMTELDALFNIDFNARSVEPTPTQLRFIRLGTSGSLREDLPVDSLAYSETAIGLDSLMVFYPLPQSEKERQRGQSLQKALQLPFTPYCVPASPALVRRYSAGFTASHTLTCPGFYAPQGRSLRIPLKTDNYLNIIKNQPLNNYLFGNLEMETAGYYAFARLLGHDFLSLQAIMANRVTGEFSKRPEETIRTMIETTLANL
ncbi:MAG: nucleoside phosphorylase [Cytophagaceae bacterium]|nr:nucleoside phosphorylase [Cytophagaceae bacterium]